MADFAETLKSILNRSMEAVSKAATNVASATRYKMSEMDNISRRREAISELGEKVYGLFQTGVELPEEILPLANEIRALDESMDALRSDRAAAKAAAAEEAAAAKAARAEAKAAAKAAREAAAAEANGNQEETTTVDFEVVEADDLTYAAAPVMEPVVEEAESEEEEEAPRMM